MVDSYSKAMMADAADEGVLVVRYHDQEEYDTADSPAQVAHAVDRLVYLFVQRGCLEVAGCTRFALQLLANDIRTYTVDHDVLSFGFGGSVPESLINKCISRMVAWTRLAITVIKTEFPQFEVLRAFSIFGFTLGPWLT